MHEDRWAAAFDRARRQHGVLHVRQAEAHGISAETVHRQVREGRLIRVQRGVVLAPGARRTFHAELAGALLAAGDGAAATGLSALYLHGVLGQPPGAMQLVVPGDRARPLLQRVDDVLRTRTLRPEDVVAAQGLWCTTAAWSLLHAGRQLDQRQVLERVVDAEHLGVVRRPDLLAVLERCGPVKGRAALRGALADLGDQRVDSLLELDTRSLVRDHGFAPYPRPFPFRCPDGRVIHLDVPFPGMWFAYECDSPRTHAGGRNFHTDRARWNQAQRGGWRIGWVTRRRLDQDAQGVVEELREAHEQADPDRPAPVATPCRRRRCGVCRDLPDPRRG